MPVYMQFGDIKGESTDKEHKDWIQTSVQVGETTIGQVASRLGVNHSDLLAANPQIKEPSNLKVGQEIHVPTNPTGPKSASGTPEQLQAKIDQGIQQAAQNLDQIIGAVTGGTAGANPQGTNTTVADQPVSNVLKTRHDTVKNSISNVRAQ